MYPCCQEPRLLSAHPTIFQNNQDLTIINWFSFLGTEFNELKLTHAGSNFNHRFKFEPVQRRGSYSLKSILGDLNNDVQ